MTRALPNPRDTEAKLQHILLHSARIFAEDGFEATSIRDISRATGVSLSGLYYYFDSKQSLLYLIQNNAFRLIVQRLQGRLESCESPVARLRMLVQNHVEYFLAHPSEMKVLSHEEDALHEPFRQEIAAIKRKYFTLARKIFDDVVAESPAPGLNARVAVLSLFGMMNWVYQWHKPASDPGAEELTDTIVGIFLHGVVADAAKSTAISEKVPAAVHSY